MQDNILFLALTTTAAFMASGIIFKLPRRYMKVSFAIMISVASFLWGTQQLGLTNDGIGLTDIWSGLLFGGLSALAVGGAIFLGSRLPITRDLFEDERTKKLTTRNLLSKTLIEIPLGTVVFEEIIFRGVLYGYIEQHFSLIFAVIGTSIFFGLWHIIPSIEFSKTNKNANGSLVGTIIGTVIFTALSGVIFALLRHWSGSILAPILLHYAVNSSSFLASWYNSMKVHE